MSRADFVGSGKDMVVDALIVDSKGRVLESDPRAFCVPEGTQLDSFTMWMVPGVAWKVAKSQAFSYAEIERRARAAEQ